MLRTFIRDTLIPTNVAHWYCNSHYRYYVRGDNGTTLNVTSTATAAEGRSSTQAHVVQNIPTGGKGYMVGDRLRVVGGIRTVPSGFTPELCIETTA